MRLTHHRQGAAGLCYTALPLGRRFRVNRGGYVSAHVIPAALRSVNSGCGHLLDIGGSIVISLAVFREWLNYNYWARDRQLQVCSRLTPEQWLRPLGNSFSSIRDTLAHMAGGEWVWLERCKGKSPQSLP